MSHPCDSGLTTNYIPRIDRGLFEDLPNLLSIDISHNDIASVAPGAFNRLPRLRTIDFFNQHATLVDLPLNFTGHLPSLEYIGLSSNEITFIPAGLWAGYVAAMPRLQHIALFENRITAIHPDAFAGGPSPSPLMKLELQRNRLNMTLDASSFLKDLGSLTSLFLDVNYISGIAESTFANFSQLRHLHLHRNSITSIGRAAFSGLPLLEKLHLERNPLREIDGAFDDMTNSSSAAEPNLVVENAPHVGRYGGLCTCPDGSAYGAGDNNNDCQSLACIGGVAGECHRRGDPSWTTKRVTCGKPKPRLAIYVSVNRMATTCPTPNPAIDADLQCVAAPCQLPLRWTGHTRVDQATASDIARIEELLGPGVRLSGSPYSNLANTAWWQTAVEIEPNATFSQYKCADGLVATGAGDTSRTCDPDGTGTFLGSPLVCEAPPAAPAPCSASLESQCQAATPCFSSATCAADGTRSWTGPFAACVAAGAEGCAPCFPDATCP